MRIDANMRAKRRDVCQICRSRKLACDGKQPACSQCILRRIPCSGYRQEFVFVSPVSFEAKDSFELESNSKEMAGHQKTVLLKSNDDHIAPRSNKNIRLETRHDHLEDDIQVILQHYSPINRDIPAESNPLHNQICGAWVEVLPLLSNSIRKSQFFSSAIKTLATALRHHVLGDKLSQPRIFEMYSISLRLMGEALQEARGAFLIEHVAAIMCLAVTDIALKIMVPLLEATVDPGWMMHVKGVGDLIERLGPEPFKSGIWHTLFVGFRPLLLISSIIQRRRTFLAREEWTTVPFRGHSSSMIQLLFNKASKLPALLERYYDMVDPKDVSNLVPAEWLREDFQIVLKSLREWEEVLHSETPSPLFWSKPNPGESSSVNVDVLWFPNIMTANSLIHCWASQIIARRHLSMLGGTPSTANGEKSVANLAEMICDSMPYLMQPNMKLTGPGSAFFTFGTAMQVFQNEPDRYCVQLSRCRQIVDQLASIGFHFPRV